jgi:hypothetical protein
MRVSNFQYPLLVGRELVANSSEQLSRRCGCLLPGGIGVRKIKAFEILTPALAKNIEKEFWHVPKMLRRNDRSGRPLTKSSRSTRIFAVGSKSFA